VADNVPSVIFAPSMNEAARVRFANYRTMQIETGRGGGR